MHFDGSAPVRKVPRRAPRQRKSPWRRRLRGLFALTFPIVLLLMLAGVLGYVRLLHGPVSLKFLVEPIERSLAGELGDATIRIDDALVRLTDSGRIEFRLSNVRLSDRDGQPIASAPLAAIQLSTDALFLARIAPARIELIDPRLLLFYSEESGLSLSFARNPDGEPEQTDAPPRPLNSAAPANTTGLPAAMQRIDLARALAEASERARRGKDATSHLREVGLRNATVIIEQPGGATSWRVPEVAIELEHRQKRSTISGKATIVSGRAPWSLVFHSEESEKSRTIAVTAGIRDLVPRTLARALPQLGLLDGFDLPVGGNANFELSRTGDVLSGSIAVEMSRGRIQLPWLPEVTFPVDAGLVDLRYNRDRGRIEVAPSTLKWGQSQLTLVGHLATMKAAGSEGWAFDLRAIEGALAAEEFGIRQIPLETLVAVGQVVPEKRHFELNRFQLKAGGADITLAGIIDAPSEVADARFEGQIGPMPLATLKAIWPRALASGARSWIGERVSRGRVQNGTFRWLSGRYLDTPGTWTAQPEQRLSLAIETSDIAMRPMRTMSPVEAPRALIRLEGGSVEVSVPEASVVLGSGRRVPLRAGRFTAVDISNDRPLGEVAFRVQSPLSPVLELIDQEPLALVKQSGISADTVDGRVEGQLKLSMPLISSVEGSDVKVDGKLRVTEGRGKQVVGGYDVQGATFGIDLVERSVEMKGEMLVAGVPTKLTWQRAFDPVPGRPPAPLRLTARLDNSDRTQLGLDVNHLVQGDVPVEVTVTPTQGDDPQIQVRADLTGAELVIDNISWRKPPGSPADVQFEIVKSKGRTELSEFRVRGENIAADGQIVIGADNRLREFSFPSFTLNLVTQLEMQGTVRADNILDVKVKGRHFDGREFFRALFSIGQVTEKPVQPPRTRAGLDLFAEIDNLAGYSDVALRGLKLRLSKRGDKLVAMDARGTFDGGKPLAVSLQNIPSEPRRLRADSTDAGQAMRLIGFYPNMQGGRVRLEVNLDGKGAAEKTGTLWVESFRVLGDPVLSEVIGTAESGSRPAGQRQMVRQATDFHSMRVPFSVGHGQFVLADSYMKGDLVGVSLCGKVDFKAGRMSLGGTYIPLQGLNNVLGGIPVFGQILSGPKSEGIFGITFAVQGSMQQPQVIVNPLSMLTPGIFRTITEMTGCDPSVIPRDSPKPAGAPQVRSLGPQSGEKSTPAPAPVPPGKQRSVQPEIIGGWTSEQTAPAKKK